METDDVDDVLELPELPDGDWEPDLYSILQQMVEWFNTGIELLSREDIEPIRYSVAAEKIDQVLASQDRFLASGAPADWVDQTIMSCRILQGRLLLAADTAHPR